MALTRCPTCGAPLAPNATAHAGATCPNCGAPLTPQHAQPSYPSRAPLPPPAAPVLTATATPPRRKSGALALLLELLIPGTGAMYAGHVITGLLWLLLTLGAAVAGIVALAHSAASPLLTTREPYLQLPTDAAAIATYVYVSVGIVALVWFAARALLATGYVAGYNHRLTHPAHATSANVDPAAGNAVRTIITILIEMIPGPIAGYGIGDMATALEAIFGHTMDGLKLSPTERVVYLGASAIPVVPARPIIAVYRYFTRNRG